jgi:hypothetical protein
MPGPYINDETPPGIKFHATPRNAVIGILRSDASVQDVADALTEAGIAPSTVHFLDGAGGVAFLERLGNWFTRALSEGLTDARESLSPMRRLGDFPGRRPGRGGDPEDALRRRRGIAPVLRFLDLHLNRRVADRRRAERVREPAAEGVRGNSVHRTRRRG